MALPLLHEARDRLKPLVSAPTRRRVARTRLRSRVVTAAARSLPDFLVIGAMRGGTSSLYRYLAMHPDIVPSLRKEIQYFTRNHGSGEGWYRAHFPLSLRMARARTGGLQTFEATPHYLFEPWSPVRAHELLGDVRLVVVVRDPVERAFSHYEHMRRHGLEDLSFADALAAEEERTAVDERRMLADPDYFGDSRHRFSYVARGRYAAQIERWLEVFPRHCLHVMESERLYTDPARSLEDLLEFLGLRSWRPNRFRNYSYVGATPVRSQMAAATREMLAGQFAPESRLIAPYLGRSPVWSETSEDPAGAGD